MIVLPSLLQGTCSSMLQIPQCNFLWSQIHPFLLGGKKKSQGNFFLPFFNNFYIPVCDTAIMYVSGVTWWRLSTLIAMPKDQYRQLALSLAKWRGALKHHKFFETSYAHRDPGDSLVLVGYNGNYSGILFFKTEYNCLWKKDCNKFYRETELNVPFPLFAERLRMLFAGGQWIQESACEFRGHRFSPWFRKIPRATELLSPTATTLKLGHPRPTLHNKKAS